MLEIEINIKGKISQQWSSWFDGLTINHFESNGTILKGIVIDQAALYGIIAHLRDMGLQLISVNSKEIKEDSHEHDQ